MKAAMHSKLLRERGLADPGQRFKLADVAFMVDQLAQEEQAVFVGQGLEQRAGLGGRFAQGGDFTFGKRSIHGEVLAEGKAG